MPAEIINLNKARKAKARAEKEEQASRNRAKFGRPKAEREKAEKILQIERSRLEGTKLANPEDDDLDPGNVS